MAETIILVDKFYAIRRLLKNIHYKKGFNKKKPKLQSANHIYVRQRRGRLAKQALMKNDPRFAEFFAWVFSLQTRLKASDKQFAHLCNVTPQSVKLWRNFDSGCGGHFPSKSTFKIMLRLEVVCQASIKVIKREVNIKDKRFPKSKIKIPRLKRLQANANY